MNQPCINIASPYIGSEHERLRQIDLENKKQWLTKEGFKSMCHKNNKDNFGSHHYVTKDPSQPPILHKFRAEDKETFLFGQFKLHTWKETPRL